MSAPLTNLDWCLLRAQRNYLLGLPDHKHIDGLINFLDDLIDYALDTGKLIGLIGPEDLETGHMYKYVRVGGMFRFFSIDDLHKYAVGPTEVELGLLESAGKIILGEDEIVLVEGGSMSLDIVGDSADLALLIELLGRPVTLP